MVEMTTHERVSRMYQHREADRVPIYEEPWVSTLDRWRREGLGEASYVDFFGLDPIPVIYVDNSPRFPAGVIESLRRTPRLHDRLGRHDEMDQEPVLDRSHRSASEDARRLAESKGEDDAE